MKKVEINLKHMRKLYRLNAMNRYNPWQKIGNENVASHSYYVSYFSLLLSEILEFDDWLKNDTLEYAILHDVPEVITNDITYDAKKYIPGLKDAEEKFSEQYLEQEYNVHDYYLLAKKIVKIADLLSVIQFTINDILLGNKSFDKMLRGAFDRLIKEISYFKNNDITTMNNKSYFEILTEMTHNLLDEVIDKIYI